MFQLTVKSTVHPVEEAKEDLWELEAAVHPASTIRKRR